MASKPRRDHLRSLALPPPPHPPPPSPVFLTITSEHIVKFPNCWLRFFLKPESRKQKNRYLSLSSQARWQFSFALTSATLHFSIFKPSQCSWIRRFWGFFCQIHQSEIILAELTILTNFRHFRYCMHFWIYLRAVQLFMRSQMQIK